MRRLAATVTCLLVLLCAGSASAGEEVIDHSPFGELLDEYVDAEGRVAYAKWKKSDEDLEKLRGYLEEVAEAEPGGESRDARLAFYLNAYNATVIASIIDHWPTEGPMKIKGFFKVEEHEIAGEEMTLDALEHSLIREEFDEPRIHFVLVCAARSCPRLRTDPLEGATLEESLEAAAREFIPEATRLEEGKVVTSRLFEWFAEDFEEAAGSVREYLARYTDGEVAEALGDEETKLGFREYDWSVNAQ